MSQRDPVLILAGGRGTRLRERTTEIPKALVEIGGRPIAWHVIQIYIAQGYEEFVLLTGYLSDQVAEWATATPWPEGVSVRPLDTGEDTPTGGRVLAAAELIGGRPFACTYGDGVADIDLGALDRTHRESGRAATVTVVQPRSPWGVCEIADDGRISGFDEKPLLGQWINGGFFRFEPRVLDVLTPDSVLEREPLERLAADGELGAYRHDGFWDCMDTYKDTLVLNDLWRSGEAPWLSAGAAART